MKLRVFRTLWGVLAETDGDKVDISLVGRNIFRFYLEIFFPAGSPVPVLEDALAEVARLGYDGVELPLKCILHLGKERSVTRRRSRG